jgi:hypothetical protein
VLSDESMLAVFLAVSRKLGLKHVSSMLSQLHMGHGPEQGECVYTYVRRERHIAVTSSPAACKSSRWLGSARRDNMLELIRPNDEWQHR